LLKVASLLVIGSALFAADLSDKPEADLKAKVAVLETKLADAEHARDWWKAKATEIMQNANVNMSQVLLQQARQKAQAEDAAYIKYCTSQNKRYQPNAQTGDPECVAPPTSKEQPKK